MEYDKLGLEIQRELTGNVKHESRRDRLGRLRHQVTSDERGRPIHWKEYQWGIDYRLHQIIDHTYKDRDVAFDYDDKGYLVRAIYNRKEEQFRTPDKLGNLYETKDKKDRKYKNSQLQQDRTYYYHYDVEGNLIFKEHIKDVGYRSVFSGGELRDLGINPKSTGKGILYTWNANGSLRSVLGVDGIRYSFKYDAFGRRIEKRRMNSSIKFVWDDNVLLHEVLRKNTKDSEDKITTWVFEDLTLSAKIVNGKAYSIINDHLGTPIMALDSEGNEVWTRLLDIYGRVKYEYKSSSLGDDPMPFIPFLQAGQYYDIEIGLAYNRFRYYDPSTGTYISQDPIGLRSGQPNIYAYVRDPNGSIDFFGLAPKCAVRDATEKDGDCDLVLTISRKDFSDNNEAIKHIQEYMDRTGKNTFTYDPTNAKSQRKKSLDGIETKKGYDRDEFPMAIFKEGGTGASVKYINPSDNRSVGSAIGGALRGNRTGSKVKIVIVD